MTNPTIPRPFIDIEASGFGARSYPIEVGIILADGSTYCTLILPESDWTHWEPSAEAVHGITREILAAHGKPAGAVAHELNTRLAGMTVYTDSWYHDFNWISRLFDAAESAPRFRLEDLRALLPAETLAYWDATKHDVTAELKLARHRASNDARILQTTLQRLS
jgi:hypothetical protein